MDVKKAAAKYASWYARHVGMIMAATIGVAIGVAVKFPTGWYLSDGVLSMVSALVQAAATGAAVVFGIRLEARLRQKEQVDFQENLRYRLVRHLWPLLTDLEIFFDKLSDESGWKKASDDVAAVAAQNADELHQSRLFNEKLDISGFEALQVIESTLRTICVVARTCSVHAQTSSVESSRTDFKRNAATLHQSATGLIDYLGSVTSEHDVSMVRLKPVS